jgi:hypothetical protein
MKLRSCPFCGGHDEDCNFGQPSPSTESGGGEREAIADEIEMHLRKMAHPSWTMLKKWVAVLRSAPPPAGPGLRQLLENAALFLTVGANYAPKEAMSDKNAATGEWLKTRGLSDVMKGLAEDIRAALQQAGGTKGTNDADGNIGGRPNHGHGLRSGDLCDATGLSSPSDPSPPAGGDAIAGLRDLVQKLRRVWFDGADLDKDKIAQECLEFIIEAEKLLARPAETAQPVADLPYEHPVAWRWRWCDQPYWDLRDTRPEWADEPNVICQALYAAPQSPVQPQGDGQAFEAILNRLGYDGQDINSITVGELRRAL